MTPLGGYVHPTDEIEINAGRPVTVLRVANLGDRPVQIGSPHSFPLDKHPPRFPRVAAFVQRLDIPAGTAARFEPGEAREVRLVPFGGRRWMVAFNGLVDGGLDEPGARDRFAAALVARGFDLGGTA